MSVTHYQYDDINKKQALSMIADVIQQGDYIILARNKETKHMAFMQGANVGDNLLDYLQHLYLTIQNREQGKKYGNR